MAETNCVTPLCSLPICRLCGEENDSGINLFPDGENQDDLWRLVNRYLPLKVENDGKYPRTICPGCHIQLEATKLFMDLIVDGQDKLRKIYKAQTEHLQRLEKERMKLEEALKSHNPNTSVETYTIHTDDSGEKYIIQIYSDGPLFPPEHELSLKTNGLEKPRRKRGRPPKLALEPNKKPTEEEEEEKEILTVDVDVDVEPSNVELDGRKRRRRIRAPARYDGVVQGKELDKMLKKEGIIAEEEEEEEEEVFPEKEKKYDMYVEKRESVIGRTVAEDGLDLGEPIFEYGKQRNRKKTGVSKKKRKHRCDICKREFLHFATLLAHRKLHKVNFRCESAACAVQSDDKAVVEQHQSETGHSGITVVENFDSVLGGRVEIPADEFLAVETVENVAEAKAIECAQCQKSFTCKQNYDVHVRAVHDKDRPYVCDVCNKSFAYSNSLKVHMIKHNSIDFDSFGDTKDDYVCEKCNKIFHHPSSLFYHKETVHGSGKRFVCNKCDKSFKHRQLLQRHQLVHTETRPFKCTRCSRAFKTKANLQNHEAVHTGIKKFQCTLCGQGFAHRTSLSLHQRWHSGMKPYECDVCHKRFTQKGNLMEHQRIHTGEKPYCCDHCGRGFTTSSQFKLHRKRHTGERPWRCEVCPKTFLHRDTLKAHMRRHVNIRPYKCKTCPRAFTESWALKRHERLHTGIKPYSCEECGKDFSDSSNLTKHKRIHANRQRNEKTSYDMKEVALDDRTVFDGGATVHILHSSMQVDRENADDVSSALHLRQLLDPQGNAINLTTPDGHPVPIVSSNDEKFQGLLPDGSLVSIDFFPSPKGVDDQGNEGVTIDNGALEFLSENDTVKEPQEKLDQNIQFLTEDGKEICLVTSYENMQFCL